MPTGFTGQPLLELTGGRSVVIVVVIVASMVVVIVRSRVFVIVTSLVVVVVRSLLVVVVAEMVLVLSIVPVTTTSTHFVVLTVPVAIFEQAEEIMEGARPMHHGGVVQAGAPRFTASTKVEVSLHLVSS